MGGYTYPKEVWSPAGGWFCDPKHWKRNTLGIFAVCVGIAGTVFMKSAELEERPQYPARPIPSQLWCKNFPSAPDEKHHRGKK